MLKTKWETSKNFFTKCQTPKLKTSLLNVKLPKTVDKAQHMQDHHLQSLEYLVIIQTSFGPLDLVSSQKNRTLARPPTHMAVIIFLSTRFNGCCRRIHSISFEHHTCIFYSSCDHHVRIYCDGIGVVISTNMLFLLLFHVFIS